jgi:aspartate racemase
VKLCGLIGGMSWESSIIYERLMHEAVRDRLGGFHNARLLVHTVDFADVEPLQAAGEWDRAGALLADVAQSLETGGAELLVLCTNTMHQVAAAIESAVEIPLLHIADATAERVKAAGLRRVGLLATRYTMERDFYRGRLEERHGLEVLVPDEPDRTAVHEIIYSELVLGRVEDASRERYRQVIAGLQERGAEAILLGCTEIMLLIGEGDARVPLFDTTRIHAEVAVAAALT